MRVVAETPGIRPAPRHTTETERLRDAPRQASVGEFGLPSRREHLQGFLGSFAVAAFLGEAHAEPQQDAVIRRWTGRQEELAQALSKGEIRPVAWMTEVERLAKETDTHELMAAVSRARISSAGTPNHNDPQKRFVRFVDDRGEPRSFSYGIALFDFSPTNVITPHGHKFMVSAHLIVAGRFRIRNYDRMRDEGDAMVIRPTRDYIGDVGLISTMSSDRDNIHWFVPHEGPATTFDVVISDLDPGGQSYDIKAIDPLGGKRLGDGSIVAPVMDFGASSAKYTSRV